MAKYRKKPVIVEAFQWTGGPDQTDDPPWIVEAMEQGDVCIMLERGGVAMYIETLEGTHMARPGDWIIKGIQCELYPCKPDIFEATYERCE